MIATRGGAWARRAALCIAILCLGALLDRWAMRPRNWEKLGLCGRSTDDMTEIALMKSLFGPVLLHTDLIDVPVGFFDGWNGRARDIWQERETQLRLACVSCILTGCACLLVLRWPTQGRVKRDQPEPARNNLSDSGRPHGESHPTP